MKRANSGLTSRRQEHVQQFLSDLGGRTEITYEAIDQLPYSPTREQVRGLSVEHRPAGQARGQF
jgi:hypothetical protein